MREMRRMKIPRLNSSRLTKLTLIPFCIFLAACHLEMYDQPKAGPYAESQVFVDGAASRPLQPGVVARGTFNEDESFVTGQGNGQPLTDFPLEVNEQVLARGEDRFNVFCTPCHGQYGAGNGVVGAQMNPRPKSFYLQELKDQPVGYYFYVITNGVNRDGRQNMYPYASRIDPDDRWAIIAYIRDLQTNRREEVTEDQFRGITPTPAATAPANATSAPTPIPATGGTAAPAQTTATAAP